MDGLADDPADVDGWIKFEFLNMHMESKIRLSTAEACFRGLSAMVVSPTFPFRVQTARFGSAECRAWCLEARAKTGGLTVILGLDRAYPTWIAICGRREDAQSNQRGMHDYIYGQDWITHPLKDERSWIKSRLGDEGASSYMKRWWPAL